ncbi:unannotated protein [freshwater metagenome]|uniref:Unannotated protein n=1 Tax=freshwater metagenome TaxID=449393 RepID=A0A6J6BEJ2_9ZZZZ|nr:DUF4259 domain-containing protein [Actinomycetota bacterium]
MTVWGMHPFDDDDLIDFSYEIKRLGLAALTRALRDARYSDSREEQHAEGFAAAFVVASIRANDAEAVSAETLALKPSQQLVDSAAAAIRVIRQQGTDYLNRWLVFGEDVHQQKLAQLDEIGQALGVSAGEKTGAGDVLQGNAPAEQEPHENSWQNQRLLNLQLLDARHKMHDASDVERDVDHTFVCASEKVAMAVFKALGEGFSIEGPAHLPAEDGEVECWVIVATKSYAPDFESTWGYTLRMFDIAFTCGAVYDGWGSPIIKRKKSWFGR